MPRETNREKVLAALLVCNSNKEAAALTGISERTVYNFLKDPEFKKDYEDAKRGMIKAASEQIQRSLAPSIDALTAIVKDLHAGKTARVQAARTLLEYGIKLAEYTSLEERVAALERGNASDLPC